VLESAETELTGTEPGALVGLEEEEVPAGKRKGIGFLAWVAIVWIAMLVLLAALASVLPIKDPINGYDYLHTKAGMFTPGHLFGTDDSGNDVLSRVIWGAQASLLIGVGSIVFGTMIGGFFGLLAGFKGGVTDTIISAVFNIFLAFPQLVLALTLVSVFSPPGSASAGWSHRIVVVIIAVGIVSIPILGRITRANTLAWSQREFVMAARAQGATDMRVMFREVLPNVIPAMLSIALLSVAVVIVLEGALAIFGLSIPAPSPSWGNMIQSQISNPNSAPTVWMVPSALILLTVLSLNYLGDVVRSKFDVREAAI
jgi:peptide/nickel transport system permease protein